MFLAELSVSIAWQVFDPEARTVLASGKNLVHRWRTWDGVELGLRYLKMRLHQGCFSIDGSLVFGASASSVIETAGVDEIASSSSSP